ncbi:P-loop containing nucleoside triphosphate hydrolase protein [Roridomyces roridus]|uniref:P-loop containing nucleoside triphosphate hydrolase protein n=1 Tax=Roridomyces roridus TaxID=1738132 RepID=A0AAD7FC11_9AGAR|nr:P-loop containing nucleoside triphosphate hydrolase protein [Roridomyces roridus]
MTSLIRWALSFFIAVDEPADVDEPSRPIYPDLSSEKWTLREQESVRYLSRELTKSLSIRISEPPRPRRTPLIIRKGAGLAVFENGKPLHPYQATDVERLLDREAKGLSPILGYTMGLGKTPTAIALICSNPAKTGSGTFRTTIVIVPNVGTMAHWVTQVKIFAPNLSVVQYHGPRKRQMDPCTADITYAAYTSKVNGDAQQFSLFLGTFHRVVLDEAHNIRNPDSAVAKASWALKKTHALCLTGTVAQNTIKDLFSLFKFLNISGGKGLNDQVTFNELITAPFRRGEKIKSTRLLVEVLKDCLIYRPKDSEGPLELRLPTLHEPAVVRVQLTQAEREVYAYIGHVHKFRSAWAKLIRLRQAVDHPALLTKALHKGDVGPKPDDTSDLMRHMLDNSLEDPQSVIQKDIPVEIKTLPAELQRYAEIFETKYDSSKLRAVWEILSSIADGEKTIIFSHFLTSIDMLGEMLTRRDVPYARYDGRMSPSERVSSLERISTDPGCKVLLLSIMAGGVGLDIQACNHVVLMDPWWNPYVEEQAISRAHRIGQARDVRVYRLVVDDSVEESIVKTQDRKREEIGGLLSLCAIPSVKEMRGWVGG